MAGSINEVVLMGFIGADPEIRATKDGRSIANMRLATSKSWNDKRSGERKEVTQWHQIVVFNEHLVDKVIKPYVKKGSRVWLRGELETRKWQDQAGNDRYTTEVVLQFEGKLLLVDSKRDGNSADNDRGEAREDDRGSSKPAENKASGGGGKPFDDTIPF